MTAAVSDSISATESTSSLSSHGSSVWTANTSTRGSSFSSSRQSQLSFTASVPSKEALKMYQLNAKLKNTEPSVQFDFALFMLQSGDNELTKEAGSILRKLADRGFVFAQYYYADALSSGILGKSDPANAFNWFILAAKQRHPEALFRASLCYENGWGTRRDPMKAVSYLRKAATLGQPGAMLRLGRACLNKELGFQENAVEEGLNWMKRAAESATVQYPAGPYELALLHEGGDYADILFSDDYTIVSLFIKSAEKGHCESAFRLGEIFENGTHGRSRVPAIALQYYTQAAKVDHPNAMLALCAWYMVGSAGILEQNSEQAFAWAHKAAMSELPKAEYTVGLFYEIGMSVDIDINEAVGWYGKAAQHGDQRARQRLEELQGNLHNSSEKKSGRCLIM